MASLRGDDRRDPLDADAGVSVLSRIARTFWPFRRRRAAVVREVENEIAFHIQERIDALVARGWTRDAARAEALRRFGELAEVEPALVDEAMRREQRLALFEYVESARVDLRLALRQLRRAPAYTVGTVLAFALGIGANATMFNVIDRLLLEPPPGIADPAAVYAVHPTMHANVSYPEVAALREQLEGVASVSADIPMPVALTYGTGADARPVTTVFVDGDYFRTLGVRAALGSLITSAATQPADGSPVAVLGYGFWQRALGGDRGVLGRTIVIGNEKVRVVGVAERGFNGIDQHPYDVWLPLPLASRLTFAGAHWRTAQFQWLNVVARLAPSASPEQLRARADATHRALMSAIGARDTSGMTVRPILPWRADHFSPEARIASLLGAASIAVLILACVNAVTLMLARAFQRRREIAVRMALGVSRRRLSAQLITDALCLSILGGAAALIVAEAGSAVMRSMLLQGFAWDGPLVDARTTLFIAAGAGITGVLTGLTATLMLLRRFDLVAVMAGGRGAGTVYRHRTVATFVVAQAAISAVLAVGALLFAKSLRQLHAAPLGIDLDRIVTAAPNIETIRKAAGGAEQIFRSYAERLAHVPGVQAVAQSQGLPYQWYVATPISVPDAATAPAAMPRPWIYAVTSNYFSTVGTRIVDGRAFTSTDDRSDAERVVILGRSLATTLWPRGGALGRCVHLRADSVPCSRVIGIAEDFREGPTEPFDSTGTRIYVPLHQHAAAYGNRAVIVRFAGDPERIIASVRAALASVAPDDAPPDVWSMQSRLEPELRPWRLGAAMFSLFGALALLLAALGVYSLMAYGTAQRTQEIGIRMAIGARRDQIVTLVGRQGVALALVGLALGLVAAAALAPVVQPFLFETSARSPVVYAAVGALLVVTGIVASIVPSVRASRIEAMAAIRES